MAINDTILTPSQAAALVGTGPHNIRRWCEWHKGKLSDSANPGPGVPRRLTLVDVKVLKHVKTLREQGLQTVDINERIAGMTFAVVEPTIDTPFTESTEIEPSQPTQPPALHSADALMVVDTLKSIQGRLEALESQRLRVDAAWLGVACFIAGLIVGLAVWWFQ